MKVVVYQVQYENGYLTYFIGEPYKEGRYISEAKPIGLIELEPLSESTDGESK